MLFEGILELVRNSGASEKEAFAALRAAEAFVPELFSHVIYVD